MHEPLNRLLSARSGHFTLESGHHGSLWLDLESPFRRPALLRTLAHELGDRLGDVDVVCGPLTGGAFVAQLVALERDIEFAYVERHVDTGSGSVVARYRLPAASRDSLRGKRIAVVDDVINAGSAARGTLAELARCGARPAALGALLVLGDTATKIAQEHALRLAYLDRRDSGLWTPSDCPLCAASVPLEDVVPP